MNRRGYIGSVLAGVGALLFRWKAPEPAGEGKIKMTHGSKFHMTEHEDRTAGTIKCRGEVQVECLLSAELLRDQPSNIRKQVARMMAMGLEMEADEIRQALAKGADVVYEEVGDEG